MEGRVFTAVFEDLKPVAELLFGNARYDTYLTSGQRIYVYYIQGKKKVKILHPVYMPKRGDKFHAFLIPTIMHLGLVRMISIMIFLTPTDQDF
jgi:hypothetical protein